MSSRRKQHAINLQSKQANLGGKFKDVPGRQLIRCKMTHSSVWLKGQTGNTRGGRGHGGLQQHKLIYLFRDKQVFSTEIYGDLISHVLFICTGFNYVLKRQHVRVGMVI